MKIKTNINKKTVFTRMCIAEAIVALLETTDFQKLKISEIIKKAGVSRMTFYKYYNSPYEALTDYLKIIISEYMKNNEKAEIRERYMEYDHILYSLRFFDQYANYFLTLAKYKLHGILLDGINRFMVEHIQTAKKISVYEMYSYAGGLLNTFLKWEEEGKKDSAEEIADIMCQMYNGQMRVSMAN